MPIRTFLRIHALFFVNCAFFGVSAGFAVAYAIRDDHWRAALWIVMAAIYVPLVVREGRKSRAAVSRFFDKD